MLEVVAVERRFFGEKERQTLVAQGGVGARPREDQHDVRLAAEGHPRLGSVEEPAAFGPRRAELHAGDVRPVIGLRHRDGVQDLPGREARQPLLLLLLGAALQQRLREDLGPGDEAPRGAQGGARELLGHDDHPEVVVAIVRLQAAVTLGDGEAEAAELRERLEDRVRDEEIVAVDLLGERRDDGRRELAEGRTHHLVLLVEQVRAGGARLEDRRAKPLGELRGERLGGEAARGVAVEPLRDLLGGQPVVGRAPGDASRGRRSGPRPRRSTRSDARGFPPPESRRRPPCERAGPRTRRPSARRSSARDRS